jgi:hypothetical protein
MPSIAAGTYSISQSPESFQKATKPTKKVSLTVFEAVGGYIVEIDNSNGNYTNDGELYIIGEDKDLGQEIGKIITHNKLKT